MMVRHMGTMFVCLFVPLLDVLVCEYGNGVLNFRHSSRRCSNMKCGCTVSPTSTCGSEDHGNLRMCVCLG